MTVTYNVLSFLLKMSQANLKQTQQQKQSFPVFVWSLIVLRQLLLIIRTSRVKSLLYENHENFLT